MTNLEIINSLAQLNLQINNLISLLSEQTVINNNEITEDNINDGSTGENIFFGSELQEEDNFLSDTIASLEGEELIEEPQQQETIVDDSEELILE